MVPLERERDPGVSATAYAGHGRTVEWHGPEYMKPQQGYRPPPGQIVKLALHGRQVYGEQVTVPQQYTTYQNKSYTVNSPLEACSSLTQYWAGSAPPADVQYQYATAGEAHPPSIAPSIQYVRPLPQQQIVVRSVSRPSPAAPSVQYARTRGRERREILHGPNIQLKQLMAQQEVQQYEQEGVYTYNSMRTHT